jgi:hypothetical protein
MADDRTHTLWVAELADETTPVSTLPLRSDASLKDTEPPPPPVTRFNHPPMCTGSRTARGRQSEPRVILHPTLLDPNADPAQVDTLLIARRIHTRRMGYLLIGLVCAIITSALQLLLRCFF